MNKILFAILLLIPIIAVSVFATGTVDVVSAIPNPAVVNFGSSLSDVNVPVNILLNNSANDSSTINVVNLRLDLVSGPAGVTFPTQTISATGITGTAANNVMTLSFVRSSLPGDYTFKVTGSEAGNNVNSDESRFTITVLPSPAVEIFKSSTALSEVNVNSEPGATSTLTLAVRNVGNTPITNLHLTPTFTASSLKDDSDNVITLSIDQTNIAQLNVGAQVDFTVSVDVDSGFHSKNIAGTLGMAADGGLQGSLPFKLNIAPLVCNSQADNTKLRLDISSPDDNDEFTLDQKVQFRMNVENKASDDKRVRVIAMLYNLDKSRKLDTRTVTQRLVSGSDKDYTMDLALDDSIESDSDIILYVKAFEVGNEDGLCSSDKVVLDVKVPEDKIAFDSVSISPTSVTCGDRVTGTLTFRNVGSNDENVAFSVRNSNLGINQNADTTLVSSDRSINTRPVSFSFIVPDNARAGDYNIDMKATYSGEQTTDSSRITVTECRPSQSNVNNAGTNGAQNNVGTQFVTGSAVSGAIVDKSFWDAVSTGSYKVPTSVWVLVDVLLFVLIVGSLVYIFARRR